MFQNLEEEGPCNGVESFGKVDLKQNRWHMSRLEVLAGELDARKFSWIRRPRMNADWLALTSSDIRGASLIASP